MGYEPYSIYYVSIGARMRTIVMQLRDLRTILQSKEKKLLTRNKAGARSNGAHYAHLQNHSSALRWAIAELENKYTKELKASGSYSAI